MDLVIIRIDNGAFGVSPDTVWYALDLLLYSASATTDTVSKLFDCALVSKMETYDPQNGDFYVHSVHYPSPHSLFCCPGQLDPVGSMSSTTGR